MASILDLDIDASSDENDVDYTPVNGGASDSSGGSDSVDEEEEVSERKPKSKKTKRNLKEKKDPEPEIKPEVPVVDEKKRADILWLDFLNDVSKPPVKKPTISETKDVTKSSSNSSEPVKLAANTGKSTVAELFEFAGETFTVSDGVCAPAPGSLEEVNTTKVNEEASKSATAPLVPKKRGGIEAVLRAIESKKKKLTTLQKTQFDWKGFKKAEGIEEDLTSYNRGKNGYIERQRFLQRSDVRSFEAEKTVRISKRKM